MKWFDDFSVKKKLMFFISLVLVVSLLIGATGTFGLINANNLDKELYEEQTVPLGIISQAVENLLTASSSFDMAILASDNPNIVEEYRAQVEALNKEAEELINHYDKFVTPGRGRENFDAGVKIFHEVFVPKSPEVFALLQKGDVDGADKVMGAIDVKIGEMIEKFDVCKEVNIQNALDKRNQNNTLTTVIIIALMIIFVIGLALVIWLGVLTISSISRPMLTLTNLAVQVGEKGILELSPPMRDELRKTAQRKDEFGKTTNAFSDMLDMFAAKAEILSHIATGDLTVDVKLKSSQDTMGISIKAMLNQLGGLFADIMNAAAQVSSGSSQIASGSQMLAHGSTEQASVVEQLSASITHITEVASDSAQKAKIAAGLEENIKEEAQKSSEKMEQMTVAVKEINEASTSIRKVIKVIDDIAFQTNILALNAAVEAARAGQHGKGFAVVADEVRNLAAKSAEAAKDTGALIANSMQKADFGVRIANETALALSQIITKINESAEIVNDIALALDGQSTATNEVNKAIEQVAQVVHQNSATSEESAAASQEMSSQANILHQLVGRFKLKTFNNSANHSRNFSIEPPTATGEAGYSFEPMRDFDDDKY